MRRVIQLAYDHELTAWTRVSQPNNREREFQRTHPDHKFTGAVSTGGEEFYLWSSADPKPGAGEMIIVEPLDLVTGATNCYDMLHIEVPDEEEICS